MTDRANNCALEDSRAERFEDGGACMAGNIQRQGTDACEWATVPEVGNGAGETQRQFANWYQSENPRWQGAAYHYLKDYPLLIEDAVQEGWIRGSRQLQKQESKVAGLWLNSQNGSEKALDHLRGYMFRVVRNVAYDLLEKELNREREDLEDGEIEDLSSRDESDRPWDDLDRMLPEIAHWNDAASTVRALLVVRGIGANFAAPTPTFLGSFGNGEEFLAGFRVWLRRTKHRNKLEWVQVVNALAAGQSPAAIKKLVGGERGTQAWWGRVRGTLHSNFDRWRQHWLELNKDEL